VNSKTAPRGAIVVGVDGSANSDLALDWAVDEATRRGLPLHIIHGIPYRSPMTRLGIGYEIDGLRQLAAGVRKDAIARVDRANPELVVTWDQSTYGPASALVDASDTADTVVVGTRGRGGFGGLLLGSVSQGVMHGAQCPVAIAHGPRESPSDGRTTDTVRHLVSVPAVHEHS
jgi:nucleotide-binding universal stress UspA family protein